MFRDLLTISPCVYGVINEYCPGKPRLGATIVKIFMGLIGIDQSCLYRVSRASIRNTQLNLDTQWNLNAHKIVLLFRSFNYITFICVCVCV